MQMRPSQCLIHDKPKTFDESRFAEFLSDDGAIVRAVNADWLLISERRPTADGVSGSDSDVCSSTEAKGVYIGHHDTFVGRCVVRRGERGGGEGGEEERAPVSVSDAHNV